MQTALNHRKNRSSLSWWRVMPGYSTRNEGDQVQAGDSIVLESSGAPNQMLHCRDGDVKEKDTIELNIRNSATRFQMVPIAKHYDLRDSRALRGGDIVTLYQRHSQAYLNRRLEADGSSVPGMIRPRDEANAVGTDRVCLRADIAWEVGRNRMKWSGAPVKHGKNVMAVTLKHVMTGLFLHSTDGGATMFSESDDVETALWTLQPFDDFTLNFNADETLFIVKNRSTGVELRLGDLLTVNDIDKDEFLEHNDIEYKLRKIISPATES
jgi:hypothetical protein